MQVNKDIGLVSEKDYLKAELTSEIKHELIDGHIFSMAGASGNHERIAGNLYRKFGNHLENSPCEPFGSDMKVKAGLNFYYPDVSVDCNFDESQPYHTDSPIIIVEVLSASTCQRDRTTKRFSYLNLPSLQEYVLIEQDFVDIEVVRRKDDWGSKHYFLGDSITFAAIALTLRVEEIYQRVSNQDMMIFLNNINS